MRYIFNVFELLPMLPEITLILSAIFLLMLGAFRGQEFSAAMFRLGVAFLLLVLCLEFWVPVEAGSILFKTFNHNAFTRFVKVLILFSSIVSLMLAAAYYREQLQQRVPEFSALFLIAVAGMMLMVSAQGLLALYMALELQSLALYVLAAIRRDIGRSSEAGLKYFILGAVASGIFLYGCSLVYGFSGTTNFKALHSVYVVDTALPLGTLIGMVFILVAMCFKVSAVPFHMWTPDVYEGSPTPVTVFFATAPKVAALAILTRLVLIPFGSVVEQWQQIVIFVSAASMLIGALGALQQVNIKRLIAFSSIGHVGYALVGLAAANQEGVRAMLFYLAAYLPMNLGLFACIMMVKHRGAHGEEIVNLSGLAKTRPFIAAMIAIFMFSMAGIPPLAGFFGKFFVFMAAIQQGLYTLALIGLGSSVIAAFYYLRVVKVMYFDEVSSPLDKDTQPEMRLVALASALYSLSLALVITPLLAYAEAAAATLF